MAPRGKEDLGASNDSKAYGTMTNKDGEVVLTSNASEQSTKSHHSSDFGPCQNKIPIETAIELIGTGNFQHKILLAAGLCFMADAMEVLLLSFLSTVLKHEWNLSEKEVDSIIAVVFAGAFLGTLVLGRAGDVYGRKPVFATTAAIIAVSGMATAFCQNYTQLLLMRFWVGFGVGGLTVPFDTLGEFLPSAARGKNLLSIEFFWTVGTLSVPSLAYLTLDTSTNANDEGSNHESHWQLFVILCSIPCFLSAFLGLLLVPESPRWLLEQRNEEDTSKALAILKAAARTNGMSEATIEKDVFPPNTRLVLSLEDEANNKDNTHATTSGVENISTNAQQSSSNNIHGSFNELFRTPDQKRLTLLLWATWFGFGFLYYGVIIAVSLVFTNEDKELSSSSYGDDIVADDDDLGEDVAETSSSSYDFDFVAIFITASAEIFGLIAVLGTIDSIGRIPSQITAYRIGGFSTFVLGVFCVLWIEQNNNGSISTSHRAYLIALAFLARMATMASSCTTWVSTSEMLATDIRSTGHGAANAMARLGGFIAPYIITERNSMGTIGVLVLLVSLVTAECASRLPETAGKPMGDTGAGVVTQDSTKQADDFMTMKKVTIDTESKTSYHKLL